MLLESQAQFTAERSEVGSLAPVGQLLKAIIAENYPGTKLAITEYAYGALDTLNGALAQADILGVFGREGLDLATIWDFPKPSTPGAFAFKMYRNFGGIGALSAKPACRRPAPTRGSSRFTPRCAPISTSRQS